MAGAVEGGQAVGPAIQTEQHEWRIERDGVEGVRGDADHAGIARDRGHDGNAGGEAAESLAEFARVDAHGPRRDLRERDVAPLLSRLRSEQVNAPACRG